MSESKDETTNDTTDETTDESGVGISDDQLPEDLVPSEDNPLAEGLPDGETTGDLLNEGKRAERSGGEQSEGPSDNQEAGDTASTDSGDQDDD